MWVVLSGLLNACICTCGLPQIGLLLLESLLLLGYFSLFHYENQAVLRWGKSPTILHKVSLSLIFYFSIFQDLYSSVQYV